VLAARSISFSTAPAACTAAAVRALGHRRQIKSRIVQAPPGVPVGSLVAQGEVELGIQQLAELINLPGITVLGPLPPAIQVMTVFSAGLSTTSTQPDAVRALLAWMVSPACATIKTNNGMESA
jgi:molybdate transport system substrate-binding protein